MTIKMVAAAAFVCLLAAGVVVAVFLQARRAVGRRRQQHISNRKPMSDSEFLAQLNVDARRHPVCLTVRRAMARMTGLPLERIWPKDKMMQDLLVHGYHGFSIEEFHQVLEAEAMGRLDRDGIAQALEGRIPEKFREYIEKIAAHWDSILKQWPVPAGSSDAGAQYPAMASTAAKTPVSGLHAEK